MILYIRCYPCYINRWPLYKLFFNRPSLGYFKNVGDNESAVFDLQWDTAEALLLWSGVRCLL